MENMISINVGAASIFASHAREAVSGLSSFPCAIRCRVDGKIVEPGEQLFVQWVDSWGCYRCMREMGGCFIHLAYLTGDVINRLAGMALVEE